jgi:hypothetical protein
MHSTLELTADNRIRCTDCGRWIHVDGAQSRITHSSRCDANAQPEIAEARPAAVVAVCSSRRVSQAEFVRAAKNGTISLVATEEEIIKAVKSGLITMSDAMNRDC